MSTRADNLWVRFIFAGPWTLISSVVVMASLATWLPPGEARVDNLVVPLVLFPAIWALLFFHAALARRLWLAIAMHGALALVCVALLVVHFMKTG